MPLRLESLAEVFAQVPDPRKPRGIRHPLQGMLALVFSACSRGSARWRCSNGGNQLQEPLAEALLNENCDYLVQIKGNQGDIQDALVNCLGAAHECKPAAQTVEKKGTPWIGGGCGLI